MRAVVETPSFLRDARNAGLTEEERAAVVWYLAIHTNAGDEIRGTGGARKIRFAGRGKGKSGGYRVITFYSGRDVPVFLLNVFAKGDRVDLSRAERNEMRTMLATLVRRYLEGVKSNVQGWKKNPGQRP